MHYMIVNKTCTYRKLLRNSKFPKPIYSLNDFSVCNNVMCGNKLFISFSMQRENIFTLVELLLVLLHFQIIHDNKSTISRDSYLLLLSKLQKHCASLFYTDGYASIKNPNISVTKFHNLDIITFHFYNFSSWLIRFEPKIYLQIILQIRIIFSKFSHSTKFNMLSMQFLPRTIDEV